MRRDGSLSYRMRNVFIQPDSYHNLPMMNERPLCEDAERSEIKRRVINRPVALNGLPCARRGKIGTSQLVALHPFDLSQYTKLRLSLFFPPPSPARRSSLRSPPTPSALPFSLRYSGSRAAGEISEL